MRRSLLSFGVVLGLVTAAPISGQTLREAFEGLYIFGDCGQPVCLDVSPTLHGRHFSDVAAQAGTNMIAFVLQSIGSSLASIPIPSSNAGQKPSFVNGAWVFENISAGPVYMERSLTLGAPGLLLVGATVSRVSPANLRGQSLNDLTLTFTHEDVGNPGLGDPDFENDVIKVTTNVDLNLTLASLFFAYGLTSSVDLSMAVPVVHASLSGTSQAQIVPFDPVAGTPHAFIDPVTGEHSLTSSSSADQSATGIGDIALRVKANLHQSDAIGFAMLGEVRLPTGDKDNFLGTGSTTARVLGVVSLPSTTVSSHINAGYTYRSGEGEASSVTLRGGLDALLSPRVTGSLEILGDLLVQDPHNDNAVTRTVSYKFPTERTQRVSDIPHKLDHVMDFVGGIKIQPSEKFRVVASLLVPLLKTGVRPNFQGSIGLERTF